MIPNLRLKDLREDRFWNQQTIAGLLNINRRTYAEYELQNNMLPIKYLPKLSNIYNVSIDYICGITNKPKPSTISSFNIDNILTNLKILRKENNLTQKMLASSLSYSQNTISEYETGKRTIPLDYLIKASLFFHISLDEIFAEIKIKDTQNIMYP